MCLILSEDQSNEMANGSNFGAVEMMLNKFIGNLTESDPVLFK